MKNNSFRGDLSEILANKPSLLTKALKKGEGTYKVMRLEALVADSQVHKLRIPEQLPSYITSRSGSASVCVIYPCFSSSNRSNISLQEVNPASSKYKIGLANTQVDISPFFTSVKY